MLARHLACGDQAIVVGNRAGVIEWANGAWTRITGWDVDRLTDKPIASLLDEAGIDASMVDFVRNNFLAGRSSVVELPFERPDGRALWIHLEVDAFRDSMGEVGEFVAVVSDITERRLAELSRESQRDRFERSPPARSASSTRDAGVRMDTEQGLASHAIDALDACAEGARLSVALRDRAAAGGDETLADLADRLVERMQQVVSLAGSPPPRASTLDVSDLMVGYCRDLRGVLPRTIELDYDLPRGLPLVAARGDLMELMLTRLLRASVAEIGDEWGTISVTTGITEPGRVLESSVCTKVFRGCLDDEKPRVFIELHDTAPPLSPAELERSEGPLLPFPASARVQALLAARRLAAEVGGELHVDSSGGSGSRVLILLPITTYLD